MLLPLLLCWLQHTPCSWAGSTYSLCTTLLGRCPKTLVPLTSWGLQHNPGFVVTASCNSLSGPPCWDSPAESLTSVALFSHGGRFHNHFSCVSSWLESKNHVDNTAKFYCPVGIEPSPLLELHLEKLSFVFSSRKFLRHLLAGWGLTLSAPLPLFCCIADLR